MTIKVQDITCPSLPCDICACPIHDGETYICLYHKPSEWNVHRKCVTPDTAMNGDLRDKLIREGYMKEPNTVTDGLQSYTDYVLEKHDEVNHPPHYKAGGIECIDYLEAKCFGYHLGNAVKYITRSSLKGKPEQDIKKAIWYLNRYLEKYHDGV